MDRDESEIDNLLGMACRGNLAALGSLLDRHRDRLMRMVAARLDSRLAPRLDPSDVVQETFLDASRKLDAFLRDRPLPFYPWLRRLAWERIAKANLRQPFRRGTQRRPRTWRRCRAPRRFVTPAGGSPRRQRHQPERASGSSRGDRPCSSRPRVPVREQSRGTYPSLPRAIEFQGNRHRRRLDRRRCQGATFSLSRNESDHCCAPEIGR